MKKPTSLFCTCAASIILVIGISSPANATYIFTDLGTLGGDFSQALAINNSGQVVGTAWTTGNDGSHATIWNGSTATDLTPGISGWSSVANSINASGQVAGNTIVQFSTWDWAWRASVWNGATVTVLSTLPGTVHSDAWAINNSGQVAGRSIIDSDYHATVWNGTNPTDLGIGFARGINDAGQIVGDSRTLSGNHHATVWNGTVATGLGTLGGTSSAAYAINNTGIIVGSSRVTGDAEHHATLWDGTVATDLGTLGGTSSAAYAINNSGVVVGYSTTSGNAAAHATLWNGISITDINSLLDADDISAGWVLEGAYGINDKGWIVGNASNSLTGVTSAPPP
jgi:probable HAF family extracellular repeat protein